MSNPYERYASATLPKRRPKSHVVQSENDAPMVLHGAAKEIAETDEQMRRYKRIRAQERKALLEGDHGPQVKTVMNILKSLTPDAAPALLNCLDRLEWFAGLSQDQRATILSLIDDAIIRMRVREGLAPIDDSLPGEAPTVFEICRANLCREVPP